MAQTPKLGELNMNLKSLSATVVGLALVVTPAATPVFAQQGTNPTPSQETPSTSESTQEEETNPTASPEEGTLSTPESIKPTAAAARKPNLQLPFSCQQRWRLDTWAHAPALDMVREPKQVGTNGATLLAPAAGTVNQSFKHRNAGNVIQINHGGGWFTTYLHLQSRNVRVGQGVQLGTVIGKVGRTGPTANNHPHLHFELGYDSNKDGKASWGYRGSERVKPIFNSVTYGSKNGQTWRNVTSQNKCS
ncbi:MAG: peptidoglycan DD-metalloendopeptidase family protein [Myxacorys chilensis ATA2-1-KO14]|nr:peptidoglycan DD-metalloendopeptidase family protein [Myxacorys chilensis ATA2-1-KO14]